MSKSYVVMGARVGFEPMVFNVDTAQDAVLAVLVAAESGHDGWAAAYEFEGDDFRTVAFFVSAPVPLSEVA